MGEETCQKPARDMGEHEKAYYERERLAIAKEQMGLAKCAHELEAYVSDREAALRKPATAMMKPGGIERGDLVTMDAAGRVAPLTVKANDMADAISSLFAQAPGRYVAAGDTLSAQLVNQHKIIKQQQVQLAQLVELCHQKERVIATLSLELSRFHFADLHGVAGFAAKLATPLVQKLFDTTNSAGEHADCRDALTALQDLWRMLEEAHARALAEGKGKPGASPVGGGPEQDRPDRGGGGRAGVPSGQLPGAPARPDRPGRAEAKPEGLSAQHPREVGGIRAARPIIHSDRALMGGLGQQLKRQERPLGEARLKVEGETFDPWADAGL